MKPDFEKWCSENEIPWGYYVPPKRINKFAEDFAEQENEESKKTAGLILKENKSLITQNKALINELHKAIEGKEQEAIEFLKYMRTNFFYYDDDNQTLRLDEAGLYNDDNSLNIEKAYQKFKQK